MEKREKIIEKYKNEWKVIVGEIRKCTEERKIVKKHYLMGKKQAYTEMINDLVMWEH